MAVLRRGNVEGMGLTGIQAECVDHTEPGKGKKSPWMNVQVPAQHWQVRMWKEMSIHHL